MYRSKELGRNTYQFLDAEPGRAPAAPAHARDGAAHRAEGRRAALALPAGRAHRPTARSSAPRRCCAGTIPSTATCRRRCSFRWPRNRASSTRSANGCCASAAAQCVDVAQGGLDAHGFGQPVGAAVLSRGPGAAHLGDRAAARNASRRGSSSKSPRRACCTTSTRSARCCTSCATKASRWRSTTSAPATRR